MLVKVFSRDDRDFQEWDHQYKPYDLYICQYSWPRILDVSVVGRVRILRLYTGARYSPTVKHRINGARRILSASHSTQIRDILPRQTLFLIMYVCRRRSQGPNTTLHLATYTWVDGGHQVGSAEDQVTCLDISGA